MNRSSEDSLGIYVHVPYCIRKCRYCDFVSFEKAPEDCYFSGLAEDIRSARNTLGNENCYYVDSVFFGGGTPSLASADQLGKVLSALQSSFDIRDAEITIEVNPETVTPEKATAIKTLGFNRISMGVQSFNDKVLGAMGRVHDAEKARQAFGILRDAGFENINLDLIFGAPEQDHDIWQETLEGVLDMRPEHVSFYSLQLEEGTPLYKDYTSGKVDLPSWEENRRMYRMAAGMLKDAGYHHYEVSNAALPGFECRHNLKYWNMQPYLGFGTSAHSFINGCRGVLPELQTETEAELKGDFVFTKLRLTDGFDLSDYSGIFGTDFREDFSVSLPQLTDEGYLELSGGVLKFTPKGLDCTNNVIKRLLDAL